MKALIITPDRPGPAILRLTLVQEGIAWFDEQNATNGIERVLVISSVAAAANMRQHV